MIKLTVIDEERRHSTMRVFESELVVTAILASLFSRESAADPMRGGMFQPIEHGEERDNFGRMIKTITIRNRHHCDGLAGCPLCQWVRRPLRDNGRAILDQLTRDEIRLVRLALHDDDAERATRMIDEIAATFGID
jgi:hypothetical protein